MTELTFLRRTGRWGDFHFVYSHGIVVRPIQEVYNRFPNVGQPAELTQCRIFDAVDSPWMIFVEQAQSIFYILQHSTLILPVSREGEVLLRLLLECLMVGENKKRYIITSKYRWYI